MNIELNIEQVLGLMDRPAFWVCGDIVQAVNPAAAARFIAPGTGIRGMIVSGFDEYQQFSSGRMYLTIAVGGVHTDAAVTPLGEGMLFALEQENSESQAALRSLSLAALELRKPLCQLMNLSEHLFPQLCDRCEPQAVRQMALMNQGLHQIFRLVGNMSDGSNSDIARMELHDITAVVQEIMDHAEPLLRSANITLSFENHPVSVYTLVDYSRLERAIYNLLSNALKYTSPGGCITVRLKRRGNAVYLTVGNPEGAPGAELPSDLLFRYLREPSLEDTRNGLGLGLHLVWTTVKAHQGRFLVNCSKTDGFQALISLPIRQEHGALRSPVTRPDYAGERDHGLIELSESLPPEWYLPKKL